MYCFQAKASTRTLTPPATDKVRKLENGPNTTQVKVTLLKYLGATSYQVQWAPIPPGGTPTNWTVQSVYSVRPATIISGLTPGTNYAFQVRALTKTGFTDWSDSLTIICK